MKKTLLSLVSVLVLGSAALLAADQKPAADNTSTSKEKTTSSQPAGDKTDSKKEECGSCCEKKC